MKKLHILATALLISGSSWAQNVPVDFESGGNGANWTWTTFENDDNPALEVVSNPASSGINTSATVGKFTARSTGQPWAGCETQHGADIGEYQIDATNSTIKIMVYKSVLSDVGIKLVTASGWAKPELKVANTTINEWEELSFDFSTVDHEGMTYDQIVVFMDFNARTAESVNYFDNISFNAGGGGSNDDEPMVAAPDPTLDAADVISLFSGVYTDITVNTWRTDWSAAALVEVDIEGNATKKYSNLDFVGIEATGDNSIDASEMNYLNMHFWTPNATTYRVKLVDAGADNAIGTSDDVEHEVVFENPTQKAWVEQNIALADFTNLTTTSNISQVILSALPAAGATLYVDNVYFSKGIVNSAVAPTFERFSVYPNPASSEINLDIKAGNTQITAFSITDLNGRTIVSEELTSTVINKTIDTHSLQGGVYFLSVTTDLGIKKQRILIQ
jgi:hypothetical protein